MNNRSLSTVEGETAFSEWNAKRPGEARSLERAAKIADALSLRASSELALLGVVGSKGKGTTAAYASAFVHRAGLKVGTILSPGLSSDRDRIRVDGRDLTEPEYADLLREVASVARSIPKDSKSGYLSPSGFFMLAGLFHFKRVGCLAAVVEAGIGGASDELSLFNLHGVAMSQVFIEHAEILGATRTLIARDKIAVATDQTRFIQYLAQAAEVEHVIQHRAAQVGAPAFRVSRPTQNLDRFPPGLNAQNAALGLASGAALLRYTGHGDLNTPGVSVAANDVQFPGRLSRHMVGSSDVIVDSSVSRDGLQSAIDFAKTCFGGLPDLILVSVPVNKDYSGFQDELLHIPTRVVFVNMEGSHLPFPTPQSWEREWGSSNDLNRLLSESRSILAVGTVTFSAAVLQIARVDTTRIF